MDKLHLTPAPSDTASSSIGVKKTTQEIAVHDTLRNGHRSLATEINDVNPLKGRLDNWEETQDNLKMNLQRNLYGLHLPVRQLMERKLVSSNPSLHHGGSNIHLDILMGRDENLGVPDVFTGQSMSLPVDEHQEMEARRMRK